MSLGKLIDKFKGDKDEPQAPPVPAKFPATIHGRRYNDVEGPSDSFYFRQVDESSYLADGEEVAIYRLEKVVKASVKVG